MDQTNTLRSKFDDDQPVVGSQSTVFEPQMVEVFGSLGADFVWIDFEHLGGPASDSELLATLTMAAEASDTELLVRLPAGKRETVIRKVLDAGVRNVLVPRVETAEAVRTALQATKFEYDGGPGQRGAGIGRSASYGMDFDREYARREDQETLLGVMIENERAVENLADILAVPELGFVMIGRSDLSVSLGESIDPSHERVAEMVAETKRRCRESGVPVGVPVSTPDGATAALEDGFDFVSLGTEVTAVVEWFGGAIDEITGGTDRSQELGY